MAQGGDRTPSNPAPVSGPGALSKRTDGGPTNPKKGQPVRTPTGGSYGEATELTGLQQGAPLGASPGGESGIPLDIPLSSGPGFAEDSAQPDVPVTDGAMLGPGAGVDALNLTNQKDEDLQRLLSYLPYLEHMANQPGASRAARNVVRQLKGLQ